MQTVDKATLKLWVETIPETMVIDVLPKEYYEKRHITGALNIPFKGNSHFASDVEAHAKSKNKRIVVYCLNNQCDLSDQAAEALTQAGFTDVYAFEDGIEGWVSINGQIAA